MKGKALVLTQQIEAGCAELQAAINKKWHGGRKNLIIRYLAFLESMHYKGSLLTKAQADEAIAKFSQGIYLDEDNETKNIGDLHRNLYEDPAGYQLIRGTPTLRAFNIG